MRGGIKIDSVIPIFKNKLSLGEALIGPFMKTTDPAFVEVAGYSGFDFVILDTEHGPCSIETMQNNVRAAMLSGVMPIIRVENQSSGSISKALDIGAGGVQVPHVQNANDAQKVISAAKFHPYGDRGVCRFVRAANYSSKEGREYFSSANETIVIIQVEGTQGIENIDDILEVEGIDIVFIGPYDLSQSLGVTGEISNPKVIEQMNKIVQKSREKRMTVGTFIDRLEDIKMWKDIGVQYLSYSVDVGIFLKGCKDIIEFGKST